jgi:HSP20 family protein
MAAAPSTPPVEAQQVPVNVYETDAAIVVVAPFPGVMPDDITVEVEGRSLSLRADMRTPAPKPYLLHEWHYGPWARDLELPEGFGGEADASFGNGQLAVRILRGPTNPARRRVAPSRP